MHKTVHLNAKQLLFLIVRICFEIVGDSIAVLKAKKGKLGKNGSYFWIFLDCTKLKKLLLQNAKERFTLWPLSIRKKRQVKAFLSHL